MQKRALVGAAAVALGVVGLAMSANAAALGVGKIAARTAGTNAAVQLAQYRWRATGRTQFANGCVFREVIIYDRLGRAIGRRWINAGCPGRRTQRRRSLSERRMLYRPGEILSGR